MKTSRFIKAFVLLGVIAIMASCEYEYIEVYTPEPPDPTDTIYFQAEITPIFESSGCTGCHKTGGTGPFPLCLQMHIVV